MVQYWERFRVPSGSGPKGPTAIPHGYQTVYDAPSGDYGRNYSTREVTMDIREVTTEDQDVPQVKTDRRVAIEKGVPIPMATVTVETKTEKEQGRRKKRPSNMEFIQEGSGVFESEVPEDEAVRFGAAATETEAGRDELDPATRRREARRAREEQARMEPDRSGRRSQSVAEKPPTPHPRHGTVFFGEDATELASEERIASRRRHQRGVERENTGYWYPPQKKKPSKIRKHKSKKEYPRVYKPHKKDRSHWSRKARRNRSPREEFIYWFPDEESRASGAQTKKESQNAKRKHSDDKYQSLDTLQVHPRYFQYPGAYPWEFPHVHFEDEDEHAAVTQEPPTGVPYNWNQEEHTQKSKGSKLQILKKIAKAYFGGNRARTQKDTPKMEQGISGRDRDSVLPNQSGDPQFMEIPQECQWRGYDQLNFGRDQPLDNPPEGMGYPRKTNHGYEFPWQVEDPLGYPKKHAPGSDQQWYSAEEGTMGYPPYPEGWEHRKSDREMIPLYSGRKFPYQPLPPCHTRSTANYGYAYPPRKLPR